MTQQELNKIIFAEVPMEKLSLLSKEELLTLFKGEQSLRIQLQKDNERLRAFNEELKQKSFSINDQLITVKNKLFGKSSERGPNAGQSSLGKKERKPKVQLPSERYPNAPLIERDITLDHLPACKCCGSEMKDSGMTEDSEFLTVIPRQFFVVRQRRHKYSCGKCHGDIQTAPSIPRITEGSGYSDEMVIDVAMSKYCDLIPIERYSAMAGREGLKDLPPQSLIEGTHNLATLVKPAYGKLRGEITIVDVLNADETPHRMLEGDDKSQWYLWGFSTPKTSYFECHDTRSGDVAIELLINSRCRYLVSDVFSGYERAVKETNAIRESLGLPKVEHVYCNSHSRRYFKQASERFPDEAQFFIDQYEEIYRLNSEVKGRPPDEVLAARLKMKSFFEAMRDRIIKDIGGYSNKSSLGKAMNYFLENYEGLTRFLKNADLPIDNNSQERLLRNPVIGRKTWYGTHSRRGAETAAILFSLVESCKLNGVNPREYFKKLVADLLQGKPAFTPSEFKGTLAPTL